jgi:UDPglucose 6-dehydrogenase
MKIAVIGTGYVGLVSGVCFSEFGHHVTCVDQDEEKIRRLKLGEIPIYEPGLAAMMTQAVAAGRLRFSVDLFSSVPESDIVFIAVGTPSRRGDGFADLTYVREAARQIARAVTGYTVLVTKSTVPVGTSREVTQIISATNSSASVDVVSNPEFLREGAAIEDFMRPNRVIIGADSDRARNAMRELYRPLFLNETPILFTDRETAELTKYAANGFLAMKISFINQIADLCEKVGADVHDVARGIGLDHRIGQKFLHPGPGYGGSCFPKDTRALAALARQAGSPISLIEATDQYNEARKLRMVALIREALGDTLRDTTIAVLGLTFKPNTDDMREAPSLVIVPKLLAQGARIRAHDPEGMSEARKVMPHLEFCADPYEATKGADAAVFLTEWNSYRALDLTRLRTALKHPVVVDLRNIYSPTTMRAAGFEYYSIGRPPTQVYNK